MVEVVIASPVEVEYAEALRWYAERSFRAAERFDEEFDQAIRLIASNPERFPRCDERHRWLLMRRFPYHHLSTELGMRHCRRGCAHEPRTELLAR
jgi:plasmid stabilization system protein ParE